VFIIGVCDRAWSIRHRKNLQYRVPVKRPFHHLQVFNRCGCANSHSCFSVAFPLGDRCSSYSFLSTTRLPPTILSHTPGAVLQTLPGLPNVILRNEHVSKAFLGWFSLPFARTIKASSPGNMFSTKAMFFSPRKSQKMRPFKRAGITGIASHP
jgi:hypothetical protein